MTSARAIVVGAGIGGLVAALDLARQGMQVTVYERAASAGGKMRQIEIEGQRIDSGPTVFTMPWVFEQLFADAGTALEDHLEIRPADRLARHAWREGGRLDLFADLDRSVDAISALAGEAEGRRYRAFCAEARQVFETLHDPFIRSQRPSIRSLIAASGLRGLVDLWRIRPFQSLWRRLGTSFQDPRLRGLFARYSTYCGSSPLQSPATLMLIAHVEQIGVWQIIGGMQRLADALAALLRQAGGSIHFETPVRDILVGAGRATGVVLESGEAETADVVIANADAAALRAGKLGDAARSAVNGAGAATRSLSAVTWSMLAETSGFELAHHNVFFPDDYPQEFIDIFEHQRLPARPAVYICAQDRGADSPPPQGPERLFFITNAPALGDRADFGPSMTDPVETEAFRLLEDCGLRIDAPAHRRVMTTPADFEARFPGTGGALYGAPAHGWRASFTRPGARSRIRGLYLAGGSAHPGPGVPMVAMSGRLAAQAVTADLGLGRRR